MYIQVSVTPGAKREKVVRVSDAKFEIAVREPAKQNLANRRVVELVARELGILSRAVTIVSGHRSPHKVLSVDV